MKVVTGWRLLYPSAKQRSRKTRPTRDFIKLPRPTARRESGPAPMEETAEEGVDADLSSSSADESSGSDVPSVHSQEEADGEVPHRPEVSEEDLLADFERALAS